MYTRDNRHVTKNASSNLDDASCLVAGAGLTRPTIVRLVGPE